MLVSRGLVHLGCVVLAGALLAGCSTPINRAPVEDRGTFSSGGVAPAAPETKPLPGAENAGKPGYYTVKPGDTLIRIGLENGQSWKDIARWNKLDNPDLIEVGQVLRVIAPGAAAPAPSVAADSGVVTRPVASSPVAPAASAAKPAASTASAPPAAGAAEDVGFIWPASGSVLAGFDEARNKGLDIGGKAGEPVLAAADGRVVYAGAGLRGYGNLVILKHNNIYLTAYAHNQTLLVKEDQNVRRGQKIAEMGSTDADRVKLHFEIRRQGKPVDPTRYLPAR
ncbi:peptidoglycan DD-metalloendopeptidase family protein [Diaphorobacter sp.]|uniref:peptidoglycan DD-metalloendopeptidase family protein n=1 Tax=Diaphorobacter sp. TaxID=1934310 RepID=UPI003D115D0D